MATGTVQTSTLPPPPPASGESLARERVIQRQLGRASLHLRLVDLAGGLAIWLIGVLALFIAAAAADHLFGLGTVGRFGFLVVLLAGSLWYLAMHVGPHLVRSINPTYAARTIEDATPTLKNSLINFLLLRQDKSHIREIVYQAVEKQAASDIVTVPVESTVDRTRLIYAGYVLCAVMAIFAAYKILSPKDPFQTVARVLAPWATIARPSRVQIIEVQPGNGEVYHGQTAEISATIRGARGGDTVRLLYSTADGQSIDRPVEMKLTAGDRYAGKLPPEEGSSPAEFRGLQQNVSYRLVAGDAESQVYRLTVISAPMISVERLEYQFPAYTRKAPEMVQRQGDIKAIEGTRVTLHAVANQPIKSAWLEMDPLENEAAAELVALTADGDRARGSLVLLLKADRQTPWHTTYQVRFHNQRSEKSLQPIVHRIDVIRDLPPEVQILQPERLRVEVPENGEVTIEVRGVDPDFGLSALRVEGSAAGKPPLKQELLGDAASQPPQATGSFQFRPREHNLSAGDEVTYAAVAEDNRVNPQTGQPEPNVARSKEYKLVITSPQKEQPGSGKASANASQKQQPVKSDRAQQPGDKNQQAQPQPNERASDQLQEPPQQPQGAEQQSKQEQRGEKSDQQKGKKRDGQQQQQQDGDSQQKGGQGQKGQQGKEEDQQGGKESASGQQQSGQSGESQSGQGQQGGPQQNGQSGSKSGSSGQKSGKAGGEQSGEGGQEQGGSGNSGDRQGQPQGGDGQGKAEHDGQAIERVFRELQERGEQNQEGQSSEAGQKQPGAEPAPMNGGKSGDRAQSKSPDSTPQNQPADDQRGGQPQSAGSSGKQGANTPNTGNPEGNDQKAASGDKGEKAQGKAGESGDRLPDEKQGQNPSQQPGGGNEGGAPQGPSKTDKGEKSAASKGEKRDGGAGNQGDEGAGQASEDKTGSGPGSRQNADRNKEQQAEGNQSQKGEPAPPSDSKRQSDSKGDGTGENSGGGKQSAGQSAGQEGNDSAGSKSAADQGAGKANETGGGETGSKAGQQQQAEGKTGQSGSEKGEGSAARAGEERSGGPQGQEAGEGDGARSGKAGGKREPKGGGASGNDPVGGTDGGRERTPPPPNGAEDQAADAANLDYARKATDMVLRKLKEDEHNPDPDLLEKLGWTRDDLAEFLRRWDALQRSAEQSTDGQRELDEALKSLGLRDPANRRRAGGTVSDKQRDLRDAGNRTAAPPRYRDLFDAFRKGAARSSP